ncbi:LysR family glycine cleavage system transcriptional activator [Aliiruegeria haliotis]|uniref:LysR family glycine cleavage system transcriptional activator n=1 Tax=Aliiruegeria haliotis TaxID=1280846 RepID=A0A2T0RSX0_9RHOB|nr:transcriptional regulator GcvA [Aliiruegeria haliotis]PRY24295.1 LysR family glycine cleavage system transcriptional activator [Aliiruegeria haliotis]
MTDRLPPLTALRAFEAAARHMSFAKAAGELGVTPAALSFQIKSLEEHLGQPVFRRLNRAVELTEAGEALAPGLSDGFDSLHRAWRHTRRLGNDTNLTVTAGPAFTAKWLAPRMYDFARMNPDIELRFSASLHFADLERDDVDVAIRFSAELPTGLHCEEFMRDWMTPMMSPAMAEQVTAPEDLFALPLIHQDYATIHRAQINWDVWCRAAGLGTPPPGGPRFSQADHAVDTAIAGGGVVLGRISAASEAMAAGLLVAPFPLTIYTRGSYRILCLPSARQRRKVAAFIDWLHEAAKDMVRLEDGRDFREPDNLS